MISPTQLATALLEDDDFDPKEYVMAAADDPDAWRLVLKSHGYEPGSTGELSKLYKLYKLPSGDSLAVYAKPKFGDALEWQIMQLPGGRFDIFYSKLPPLNVQDKLYDLEDLIERCRHDPERIMTEIWRLKT